MGCGHRGGDLGGLPYTCQRCGEGFCTEHRLPEKHGCEGLKTEQAERALKRDPGELEAYNDDPGELEAYDDDIDRAERAVRNQPDAASTDQTVERRRAIMWMLAILAVGVIVVGVLVYGV